MDIIFAIRSLIFFVAGSVLILFPKRVYQFQIFIIKKLRINYNIKREAKYYAYTGIIFIIISILLLVYSLMH